jgi:hypothetical protein
VVVLGMHRSGTSMLTVSGWHGPEHASLNLSDLTPRAMTCHWKGLLGRMGIHLGPPSSLLGPQVRLSWPPHPWPGAVEPNAAMSYLTGWGE